MKRERKTRRRSEKGIALLIAIFVLLLISVVAIAVLVSSGTETALGANYRTSSSVYYAALAGLEEARGRLLPNNSKYFGAAVVPTPLPLGQTIYVINRSTGDNIVPWDSSNTYYDNEYQTEFGTAASSASWQSVSSVWDNNIQGIPGPIFKWVRINAASEQSLFLQVNSSGSYSNSPAIYYDPFHLNSSANLWPSLVLGSTPTAVQALEVTAMASLPTGSKKILQYLVAPVAFNLTFPSALTMDGNNVTFSVPSAGAFHVSGTDQNDPLNTLPNGCMPGPSLVAGVGYTNNSDASQPNIGTAIAIGGNPNNYTGLGGSKPNVLPVGGVGGLAANLQSVSGLNYLVQTITQNADVVISGPATQSNMPAAMSRTNPMTIVVNGDLTLNGWHNTGFGILLVTGTFTYDPDASWDGIVLVIGEGVIYSHQGGAGQFYGAMLVANTIGGTGNKTGPSSFDFTSGAGSDGIYYSSCWINYVQAPYTPYSYKVLSFHEIRQ
jgi:Tfp pilus assembly protein PilX